MNKVISEMREQPSDWQPSVSPPVPEGALAISNSEIQSWKRCRRKWFLHYYLGWQPDPLRCAPTSTSLLGTRGHIALQGYYGHALNPLVVLHSIYTLEMEKRPDAQDDLRKEYDMLVAMLEGYAEWLTEENADQGLVPVGAEMEMSYPLGNMSGVDVWLTAHLDVVVFDRIRGRYMFIDHKFVASFDALNDLARNEQMKTYVLLQRLRAAADGGTPVDGGIFNMLKRSKRTARANPPFYKREHVTYNDADMKSMWYRVTSTVSQIVQMRQTLDAALSNQPADHGSLESLQSYLDYRDSVQQYHVPPTPSHDCSWDCPFAQQCIMMDDGSRWGAALSGTFIQGDPYDYYGRRLLRELSDAGRL